MLHGRRSGAGLLREVPSEVLRAFQVPPPGAGGGLGGFTGVLWVFVLQAFGSGLQGVGRLHEQAWQKNSLP